MVGFKNQLPAPYKSGTDVTHPDSYQGYASAQNITL